MPGGTMRKHLLPLLLLLSVSACAENRDQGRICEPNLDENLEKEILQSPNLAQLEIETRNVGEQVITHPKGKVFLARRQDDRALFNYDFETKEIQRIVPLRLFYHPKNSRWGMICDNKLPAVILHVYRGTENEGVSGGPAYDTDYFVDLLLPSSKGVSLAQVKTGYINADFNPSNAAGKYIFSRLYPYPSGPESEKPAVSSHTKFFLKDVNKDGVSDLVLWNRKYQSLEKGEADQSSDIPYFRLTEESVSSALIFDPNLKRFILKEGLIITPPRGVVWRDLFPKYNDQE
jgi:hypothetical protein